MTVSLRYPEAGRIEERSFRVPSFEAASRTVPALGSLLWALLAPGMRVWRLFAAAKLDVVPRPTGTPRAEAAGPLPHKVLLFGSGPAVGWGVSTHELALPGFVARELARTTGRGATVDVYASRSMTVESSIASLPEGLDRYDAIVITLGINDALSLIRPAKWTQSTRHLIGEIRERTSPSTRIVVAGMQPLRSIPTYDSVFGSVADKHARMLNVITRQMCAALPNVEYAQLERGEAASDRHRSPEAFRSWARALVNELTCETATAP